MMHTLSFYYPVTLAHENDLPDDGCFHPHRDHPDVEIGWVSIGTLAGLTVYPEFLKLEINHLKPGHFITRV